MKKAPPAAKKTKAKTKAKAKPKKKVRKSSDDSEDESEPESESDSGGDDSSGYAESVKSESSSEESFASSLEEGSSVVPSEPEVSEQNSADLEEESDIGRKPGARRSNIRAGRRGRSAAGRSMISTGNNNGEQSYLRVGRSMTEGGGNYDEDGEGEDEPIDWKGWAHQNM